MRQIFEKRLTPEDVRAFEVNDYTFFIVASPEWIEGEEFNWLGCVLSWDGMVTQAIPEYDIEGQLDYVRRQGLEEVVL